MAVDDDRSNTDHEQESLNCDFCLGDIQDKQRSLNFIYQEVNILLRFAMILLYWARRRIKGSFHPRAEEEER